MPNYSFSRLERAYLQNQPTFGTIPNTSGTASVTNSNACRFMRMELQNEVALLERPDKTGTRSQEGMTSGRKAGRWSIEMSLLTFVRLDVAELSLVPEETVLIIEGLERALASLEIDSQ